jgi:hypothetical protein
LRSISWTGLQAFDGGKPPFILQVAPSYAGPFARSPSGNLSFEQAYLELTRGALARGWRGLGRIWERYPELRGDLSRAAREWAGVADLERVVRTNTAGRPDARTVRDEDISLLGVFRFHFGGASDYRPALLDLINGQIGLDKDWRFTFPEMIPTADGHGRPVCFFDGECPPPPRPPIYGWSVPPGSFGVRSPGIFLCRYHADRIPAD